MNFDEVYNSMLQKRGGSVINSDIRNSKESINNNFKNDPSYKLAKLKKRDDTNEEMDLDTRLVNIDTDTKKKKIYVRPDIKIDVGDYISYPDNIYLVMEVENNLISPYGEGKECNHLFKWMYKGNLHKAYGVGTNQTKYTLGTDAIREAGIIESDSRFAIDFPNDTNCKTIRVGQRFLFNDGAWKVTQVEYVSSKDSIRSILLGQDSINIEIDDINNEIAGAFAEKHTYTYNVPNNFSVTKDGTYTLVYSIKNEKGQDFDYSLVSVSTTSKLIQVNNNKGVITIKGVDIGTGSIVLSVPSGETTKEFNIDFSVKAEVVNQINYDIKDSNGYEIKQYEATTLAFSKLLNGVVQNDLKVEYELDSVGQSLVANKQIIITQKSNNVIWISNEKVNTTKQFVLTVRDSIDKTIILDKKNIKLIKGV